MSVDTIAINESTTLTRFDQKLVYGIDNSNSKEIADIIDQPGFFSNHYKGDYVKGGNIWATIVIKNEAEMPVEYICEVKGYKGVKVFFKELGSDVFQVKTTGRFVPFPENELGNFSFRNNKVQLKLLASTTYELYLYYEDPGIEKIEIGLQIAQRDLWSFHYNKLDTHKNLLLGLFFGVAIILALINLVYYFFLKDKTYLNYFVYLTMLVLFEGSRYGFLDSTPVSQFPITGLIVESCILLFAVISYLVFLKSFVNLRSRFPKWDRIFNILIGFLIVAMVGVIIIMGILQYPRTAIYARNYFIIFTLPFVTALLFYLVKNGNRIDGIFVIGSFVLMLTGLISLILDLFFFETLYPDIFFQVGTIIEITIFGIALGMKSRQSELYQQEIQLQLIDQLEQYAHITAHNLRAPVARLKGLIYIFRKLGGVDRSNVEIVQKISNSAFEMDDVLTDMNKILELKDKNQHLPKLIDFRQIIEKVESTLHKEMHDSGAELKLDLGVSQFYANEAYLESILYNLMSNAIKYRLVGRPLEVLILSRKLNSKIVLEFSDNGIGIDTKKFKDKLFGLYQRFHDHVEGKGLGLYLVKTQVEAMEGNVKLQSKVDTGTVFTIILPNRPTNAQFRISSLL